MGFHIGLLLGRVGFHGNISRRMLCLSETSFLFSCLVNTGATIRRAVTGPFLADPHHSCLVSAHYFFSLFLSLSPCHCSVFGTSQLSSVTQAKEAEPRGLVRLQGVAFPGEKDKQEWEREQEEAGKRDHRRIGTVGEEHKASQKKQGRVCMFCYRTRSCSSLMT